MHLAYFHFAEPGWLWLAVIAPMLLFGLQWHAARARRRQLSRMATAHFLGELTASHSPARRRFKNGLLVAACVFAGLALARPQWGTTVGNKTWLGEDLLFVLDCSQSMSATDVLPNRMESAKYAILNFVQRHSHGRVGLVAFAGSAFIECPLTFDTGAFDQTLMAMDEKSMPIPGTDIGQALQEADKALPKNDKHKLVVLVTDGEDLEDTGVAEAKRLATNGVVVFTVGVGTPAGKDLRMVNAAGKVVMVRDAQGNIVRSRLDEKTLREIAEATGGRYFRLGQSGAGLARIIPAIHRLEISRGRREAAKNGVDRFEWFIAVVLTLLVAESLIGTRRKNNAQRHE